MYQYGGIARNKSRRNEAIVKRFNEFPTVCPDTGLRYDINSVYEKIADEFYISKEHLLRILAGGQEHLKKRASQLKLNL